MTTGPECVVCHATKPGARLCRRCTDDLERVLAELPAQHDDLQAVATRQAAGPLGLGDNTHGRQWTGPFEPGSLGDAPWVFAPGAADQLWALENTVTTWASHLGMTITEQPGERFTIRCGIIIRRNRAHLWTDTTVASVPRQPVALIAARWLFAHLTEIRNDEDAEQLHDELTALAMENARWTIGHHGETIFAGTCDAPDIRVAQFVTAGPECRPFTCGHQSCSLIRSRAIRHVSPRVGRCGADLYAPKGASEVKCRACGQAYPMIGQRGEIEDKLDDQWARPHLIADSLTTLDEPVNAATLRKWIERDAKLAPRVARTGVPAPHPMVLQRGIDDDGHALYRVGDVRARVAWSRTQARLDRVSA